MPVCTYDNPNTMARECWKDGQLVCKYDVTLFLQKGAWPPPANHFFFGANIGHWRTGQFVGDLSAIAPNH